MTVKVINYELRKLLKLIKFYYYYFNTPRPRNTTPKIQHVLALEAKPNIKPG